MGLRLHLGAHKNALIALSWERERSTALGTISSEGGQGTVTFYRWVSRLMGSILLALSLIILYGARFDGARSPWFRQYRSLVIGAVGAWRLGVLVWRGLQRLEFLRLHPEVRTLIDQPMTAAEKAEQACLLILDLMWIIFALRWVWRI
jgi:hypothetical protein